jgi:hypothetical protein
MRCHVPKFRDATARVPPDGSVADRLCFLYNSELPLLILDYCYHHETFRSFPHHSLRFKGRVGS